MSERRRPAWDEVRENERRNRDRLDAEHRAAATAAGARPTDVWRVCGYPLTLPDGRCGCACRPFDPTPDVVAAALARAG